MKKSMSYLQAFAILIVASSITWGLLGRKDCDHSPQQIAAAMKSQVGAVRAQDLHTAWLEDRQRNMDLVERGSNTLQAARDVVAATNITIPRDAAICLEARRQIDYELMTSMVPGQEFGPQLSHWHDRTRAVGLFCDYALSIGGLR